jgi:hypothetical protein
MNCRLDESERKLEISMSLFYSAKQKIRNIQRTIDALLDGDFPLSSGRRALQKLSDVFAALDKKLDRAEKLRDDETVRQIANNVNVKVYQVLPVLGFILRSTNVRNAFELLDPLQTIASAALQGKPQLLLSSEWDYVPFAYPQSLEDLKSFVLIGLPASEAASALLVPLAGHELGHAVWRNLGVEGSAHATLQYRCEALYAGDMEEFKRQFPNYEETDIVYRELLPEAISQSVELAVFQAEELFCDLFAYAIFGESYVHAFAYILAPGSGGVRRSKHPSYKTRISVMTSIANREGQRLPSIASLGFSDELETTNPQERFLIRMAERSVAEVVDGLWQNVLTIITSNDILRPNITLTLAHHKDFQNGIPAHHPRCLGDIINAGWQYYRELQGAKLSPRDFSDKTDHLNEMLLKSIEVLEFHRRTGAT